MVIVVIFFLPFFFFFALVTIKCDSFSITVDNGRKLFLFSDDGSENTSNSDEEDKNKDSVRYFSCFL